MAESESSDPLDSPSVKIKIEEWQRLHTREFSDKVKDDVWGKIWKIVGGTSLAAMITFFGIIYFPVREHIVSLVTKDVAGGLVGQIKEEVLASTRTEASSYIGRALSSQGTTPAEQTLQATITNTVKRVLTGEGEQLGLVREALVGEARQSFLSADSWLERAYMFRLLHVTCPPSVPQS